MRYAPALALFLFASPLVFGQYGDISDLKLAKP